MVARKYDTRLNDLSTLQIFNISSFTEDQLYQSLI
jgi:hypothetical protein